MALQFHPKPGAIVMAQFPLDYLHGEMEKRRPVIVVSRRGEGSRQRCATVVPISMTAPRTIEAQHVLVPTASMPKGLRDSHGDRFAKCDCVNTLSLERMDLVAGPRVNGRRHYEAGQVPHALLLAVRKAVAGVLGIHAKTWEPISSAPNMRLTSVVVSAIADAENILPTDGTTAFDFVPPHR